MPRSDFDRATFDTLRLITDIGSTHARFAVEAAPGVFSARAWLLCDDHADFRAAVQACPDRLPAGCAGVPAEPLVGREITRRALVACDAVCVETPDLFCALLGTAAVNLAVTLGARGGIYIGGAIVLRLGAYFDRSPFRARFEDRGRFSR